MTTDTTLETIAAASEAAAIIDGVNDLRDRLEVVTEVETGVEHVRHFITADGNQITPDFRKLAELQADGPNRSKDIHTVYSLDSLVVLAEELNQGPARIWADPKERRITCVLDDAERGTPRWRENRIEYRLEFTPRMLAWRRHDRAMLSQQVFAEHLEDRMRDVVSPPAADLLEIAQTLTMSTQIDFRSGHRLRDGQTTLKYVEETDAQGGTDGQLEIPGEFDLALPVFVGDDGDRPIRARFRYRLRNGDLTLGYILDDVDQLIEDAFTELVARVTNETEIPVIYGAAGPVAFPTVR